MKISRTSSLTGKDHLLDLPITDEQMLRWKEGELIQNAMPHLTPDQREFLMTGITLEEWKEHFGDDEGGDRDGWLVDPDAEQQPQLP